MFFLWQILKTFLLSIKLCYEMGMAQNEIWKIGFMTKKIYSYQIINLNVMLCKYININIIQTNLFIVVITAVI